MTRKITFKLSIILLLSLVLAGCGGQGSFENETNPEVLARSCIGCHGTDLSGRSAPSLLELDGKYNEQEIAEIILNGLGRMPQMKNFSEEQASLLADWLLEKQQ
ncbi:c-type cytochrome [Bacillus horti]|uniref:Mono/diheme cytochrome c family protein n=1 Tax=Caldalkalibacillus horti TaxID=77523 RepID=A0ABT9W1F0_9BACI|nr:cytochrome c [Bacillus horti]MDQ0166892.1 mono/diheme cytochrome c family protein [Bacillus horti]